MVSSKKEKNIKTFISQYSDFERWVKFLARQGNTGWLDKRSHYSNSLNFVITHQKFFNLFHISAVFLAVKVYHIKD